jgi:transposase
VFEGGEGNEIATIEYNWKYIKEKRKRGVFEGGEGKEISFRIT